MKKILRYFIWGAIKLTIMIFTLFVCFPFWIVLFCIDIGSRGETDYFDHYYDKVMDWFDKG